MNIDPEHKPFLVDTNLPNPYQGLQYVNFLEEFWAMNFGYQNVKPRDPRNCWCCPSILFWYHDHSALRMIPMPYPCHMLCRKPRFLLPPESKLGFLQMFAWNKISGILESLEGQDLRNCNNFNFWMIPYPQIITNWYTQSFPSDAQKKWAAYHGRRWLRSNVNTSWQPLGWIQVVEPCKTM